VRLSVLKESRALLLCAVRLMSTDGPGPLRKADP
jgi:hypothetical protein